MPHEKTSAVYDGLAPWRHSDDALPSRAPHLPGCRLSSHEANDGGGTRVLGLLEMTPAARGAEAQPPGTGLPSMANEEHLKILKQGVTAWNQWRKQNAAGPPYTDVQSGIDLQHADLRGMNLTQADLSRTNLTGANLTAAVLAGSDLRWAFLPFANLSEANLSKRMEQGGATYHGADISRRTRLGGAQLFKADLSGANLLGADLFGANLQEAILKGANLEGADLSWANLENARLDGATLSRAQLNLSVLDGADFNQAIVGNTTFGDIDLSEVRGLDTVQHQGPSTIGIDVIYRSKGKIPEVFLRGAGIPDVFIAYIGSLVGQPILYYSCFISHSTKDQAFAERLHADLQGKGVRCWFASEDLKIGARLRPALDESIRLHDKVLLVLSKHSLASQWVEQEVETALARERKEERIVLFPIRVDTAIMKTESGWPALIENTRSIGDFTRWKEHESYQRAFARLLSDLQAEKTKE